MIGTLLQVALGGAIGASARWGMGLWVLRVTGPGFPLAVLSVNVLGSFVMGLAVVAMAQRGLSQFAPLVQTGILGGFTTFSAFSLEAFALMEKGQAGQAAAYILLSVGASIGGLYLGVLLGRGLLA
ncbi:fluoride efflux transporter CrcB [Palleronia sediminis]|uniref:Fluoride-specific ion channel FluC n=1 Tax=Palleronia sediminis TaxID=2547833 RepID=A0A4R6A289_9RHOB|nr:fluoride efflux transporter CrcB [Palleronia sediminis]TDL77670.1 fluoride efflux transporter CrcB [Palleronia sediminis]